MGVIHTELSKPSRKQIMTSGAPLPVAVLSRIESLGFVVSHEYGLTETAGVVVSCAWTWWSCHDWSETNY
ncbi:putative 4-coumarate--CoA ligase [Rosa chinensis]|uniref:Putative 4-coumarate--CoA ligase n=1 Tax=Rosa chinensis TaxID=74649 RepID=A0A2P6Q724_ROSCH|nr:putative 4-coumarate--CoA ligase [Rosa chinensis]